MKSFLLLVVLLGGAAIGATACGGIAIIDDGAGGNTSTTGSPTSTTKSATASTRASSAVQNSANTMSSGSPDIRASITEISFFGDCQLEIGTDPIQGSVIVRYDNVGAGDGFLNLVSAQIGFSSSMEAWLIPITLQPTSSGRVDAGVTNVVEHFKVPMMEDTSFVCNLCGRSGTVTLGFDNGTQVGASFFFTCGV